jgi:GT2 family glycosyltransferase
MPFLRDVTLIIKTFERRDALCNLLDSIRACGWDDLPILIADDSQNPYKEYILKHYGDIVDGYLLLPFDSGLSKGRNELLRRVKTKYFVLNDDDFIYDQRTRLRWMYDRLERTDIELLGGMVYDVNRVQWPDLKGIPVTSGIRHTAKTAIDAWNIVVRNKREKPLYFFGNIDVEDGTVHLKHVPLSQPTMRCDFTLNFFMADTKAIGRKAGGWDPELKLSEHWEFFYRAKRAGLQVAMTGESGCLHKSIPGSDVYSNYRKRDREEGTFHRIGLSKHGFRRLILNGYHAYNMEKSDTLA